MDTNLDKKMSQKFKCGVTTKYRLTNIQKAILKEFFENGPSLRSELSNKSGKKKRGESYNKNLDKLIYLNQLTHNQIFKELSNLKHADTSMIKNDKLRRAIKKAVKNKDFSRPRNFTKNEFNDALIDYNIVNYNEPVKNKIGESLYTLTIWGIISHLRNEDKFYQKTKVFFPSKEDEKENQTRLSISDNDLQLVLKHFSRYFGLIVRKWDYLCQYNDSDIVNQQLFDLLCLANYYYEILNADFEKFENSALDDIQMKFFIPHTLDPNDAEKWMRIIVRDNEIYDYLSGCFTDLQQNYKINQKIVTKYKHTLESFRKNKKKQISEFFKDNEFIIKVPTNRKLGNMHYYLGNGYYNYHVSNFLNVLDFGPLKYRLFFVSIFKWTQKKYRTNYKI